MPGEVPPRPSERNDRSAFESVRDQVREAIDHGLEWLEHERAAKGNPGLGRRLARFITAGRQE
jgi:hypothetical protein